MLVLRSTGRQGIARDSERDGHDCWTGVGPIRCGSLSGLALFQVLQIVIRQPGAENALPHCSFTRLLLVTGRGQLCSLTWTEYALPASAPSHH